jgi:hypothetical protein
LPRREKVDETSTPVYFFEICSKLQRFKMNDELKKPDVFRIFCSNEEKGQVLNVQIKDDYTFKKSGF